MRVHEKVKADDGCDLVIGSESDCPCAGKTQARTVTMLYLGNRFRASPVRKVQG